MNSKFETPKVITIYLATQPEVLFGCNVRPQYRKGDVFIGGCFTFQAYRIFN